MVAASTVGPSSGRRTQSPTGG